MKNKSHAQIKLATWKVFNGLAELSSLESQIADAEQTLNKLKSKVEAESRRLSKLLSPNKADKIKSSESTKLEILAFKISSTLVRIDDLLRERERLRIHLREAAAVYHESFHCCRAGETSRGMGLSNG